MREKERIDWDNPEERSEYQRKRYRKNHPIKFISCKNCGEKVRKNNNRLYCFKCNSRPKRSKRFNDSPKGIFGTIKRRSKKRNTEFGIEKQEFINWYKKNHSKCHYCGILKEELPLISKFFPLNMTQRLTIDRIDNNKGYEKGNIVCACTICNLTKLNIFDYKEFKELAKQFIKPKINELRNEHSK